MENKTEFKKGDKVVLCLDYMGDIKIGLSTIKSMTPKGKITTENGSTFDSDGHLVSKERFKTVFGYILPYDDRGKEIISGKRHITNINEMLKNIKIASTNIYGSMYRNKQCNAEKLASILDKLNEIQKELDDMV